MQNPGFAILLRRYRDAAALTQEQLAERSGVSVRAISDLERGAKTRPQRATLRLLVAGLSLDDDERAALEAAVPSRHRASDVAVRLLDLPVGGFLGAVPERPIVARAREIERLRAVVDVVRGSEGRLVLLAGEAGIGKTRLAQEGTLIARASGLHLAAGRCDEPQQTVAYYPFLEILARVMSLARPHLGDDPLESWPQLGSLLPDQPLTARLPRTGEGDQQRLFWAVSRLLEALARVTPLVLALDDLHWADQSSLALLHHLARHLRQAPVLLLGTYRDTDIDRRWGMGPLLRDLHREHLVEEIAVGRLGREETGDLIASLLGSEDVSPTFVALVHDHTEGNAFFVEEMVHALLERGALVQHDGVWESGVDGEIVVPDTVQEAIEERVARLSGLSQSLLSEASVLGQPFEFDELHAMGDRTEQAVEEGLDEAVRARVLRVREGGSYSFNHALTQHVLFRALTPRQRRRLHRAAGDAIEQQAERIRDERAVELAWHLSEGGARDRALPYVILAGDQAEERYAHREAERHYQVALTLARKVRGSAVEADILEKLGRVLTNVGRYEEARGALEQALSLYRATGDQEGEIRTTVQIGSVHRALGTPAAGIGLTLALLDSLHPGGREKDIAELYIVLETLDFATGRYSEGLDAAERAVGFASQTGDIAALTRAETSRGSELLVLGRLDESLAALERAIQLGETVDDPYNLTRALDNASDGYRARGDLARSREIAERSLALQERVGNPWGMTIALSSLGASLRALGEWEPARRTLERGETLLRTLGPSWWATYLLIELGGLYLDLGERERGTRMLNEGITISRDSGHLEGIRAGELALAQLDLREGRPQMARQRLEPLLDRPGLQEYTVTKLLPALGAAYGASGDLRQAETTVQEAVRRAEASRQILALASAFVARGKLMAEQGEWAAAGRDFGAAVHMAGDMPHPYLGARCLFAWGVMDRERGESEAARERLTEALAIFRRLGAKPWVERTEKVLTPVT